MASESEGHIYTIHGVCVHFPCKAYPSQLSMMDKVIKSLERKQNSLLESPTGSGKSLALLCSSIAWQQHEYLKILKEQAEEEENKRKTETETDDCCQSNCESSNDKVESDAPTESLVKNDQDVGLTENGPEMTNKESVEENKEDKSKKETETKSSSSSSDDTEDDEDFQPAKKRFRTPGNDPSDDGKKLRMEDSTCESDSLTPQWKMELIKKETSPTTPVNGTCGDKEKDCCGDKEGNPKKSVPKIYFGTRTHKQIAQIARELGKTAYKNTKMCILSSREHTCIHPVVSKGANKNEECRELLDGTNGGTCRYYLKVHAMNSQHSIKAYGLDSAWDIEDLVTLGKKIKACPYYAAREIMKEADIVFCPYNYLIDPRIRMQMDIDLTGQIVVLDEAHNVEDSARDSASLTLNTIQLQDILSDLDKMVSMKILPDSHRALHLLVGSLFRWINESSDSLESRGFETANKILTGVEMIRVLESMAVTPQTYTILYGHLEKSLARKNDQSRDEHSLTANSIQLLEGLFLVLGYLLGYDGKFITDYRIVIQKSAVFVRPQGPRRGWIRRGTTERQWAYSLNFWCLNPAVVFSEIGKAVRSVVLTSGTLSPMNSFSSELGEPFPIKMEANHIIGRKQAWISTLSVGPSGSPLNASYRSAETFNFQDEVGQLVLQVCKAVPHGVLCFLPSYSMMEKLCKRWQQTGLWTRLEETKLIVAEPRGGNKADFDVMLTHFYNAVQPDGNSDEESSCDGALFFAVCRGKVSEGLDFADNNARAVITVGIPFPNIKDTQIELKKKFNNQYASERGLLSGNEWYEIQAYRALNQALGRCIRHRNDWGAILLVDERFSKSPKYTNGLSKWVRQRIQHYTNFHQAMSSLNEFAQSRKIEPCPSTQSVNMSITSTPSGNNSFMDQSNVSTPASEVKINSTSVLYTHSASVQNTTPAHSFLGHSTTSAHTASGHNTTPAHAASGHNTTPAHAAVGHNTTPLYCKDSFGRVFPPYQSSRNNVVPAEPSFLPPKTLNFNSPCPKKLETRDVKSYPALPSLANQGANHVVNPLEGASGCDQVGGASGVGTMGQNTPVPNQNGTSVPQQPGASHTVPVQYVMRAAGGQIRFVPTVLNTRSNSVGTNVSTNKKVTPVKQLTNTPQNKQQLTDTPQSALVNGLKEENGKHATTLSEDLTSKRILDQRTCGDVLSGVKSEAHPTNIAVKKEPLKSLNNQTFQYSKEENEKAKPCTGESIEHVTVTGGAKRANVLKENLSIKKEKCDNTFKQKDSIDTINGNAVVNNMDGQDDEYPNSPLLFPESPSSFSGSLNTGEEQNKTEVCVKVESEDKTPLDDSKTDLRQGRKCRSLFKRKRQVSENEPHPVSKESKTSTVVGADDQQVCNGVVSESLNDKVQGYMVNSTEKKSNVRFAKNSSKLSSTKRTVKDVDEMEDTVDMNEHTENDRGSTSLQCDRCHSCVISGILEKKHVQSSYFIMSQIKSKGRRSSLPDSKCHVYVGTWDGPIGGLVPTVERVVTPVKQKASGPSFNSFYCPVEERCYIPLCCKQCSTKSTRINRNYEPQIIAAQVISTAGGKSTNEVWLLASLISESTGDC